MAIASRLVPTWRTLDEAAAQTGISRRTLTRWISEGRFRAYSRAGDRRRFVDLDDIRKLQELRPVVLPSVPSVIAETSPERVSRRAAQKAAADRERRRS